MTIPIESRRSSEALTECRCPIGFGGRVAEDPAPAQQRNEIASYPLEARPAQQDEPVRGALVDPFLDRRGRGLRSAHDLEVAERCRVSEHEITEVHVLTGLDPCPIDERPAHPAAATLDVVQRREAFEGNRIVEPEVGEVEFRDLVADRLPRPRKIEIGQLGAIRGLCIFDGVP